MANRYWVGGAGNWSSTTKWSTSSGGASGASVPISTDDAIFDANSGGKFTATVDTAQSVNSITITPSAVVGVQEIALSARLTTNNLTTTGTAGNNRIWFRSTTYGIDQDFSINGAVSISDCDFRDIYVIGTAAPISGTRIGNLRGCSGITFSTTKTVYWNLAGAQNWSATGWATTSAGTPSTDNFPLAQDTATFTDAGSVTGTITMNSAIPYTGTVDMSGRTSAMTLATSAFTIYGDWKNGSGTTLSGTAALTYSGRNTQTITSASKTFTQPLTVDSYGGTVQLADALNIGTNAITVTNGTFDTKNFNVTALTLSFSNSNVRAITLGSSTVALSAITQTLTSSITNLTFNAGTSQINFSGSGVTLGSANAGLTFYNVSFTDTTASTHSISGGHTFNNLTITAPASAGLMQCTFGTGANQTITGTLTVAGATAVRRIFLQSSTLGNTITLTVGTLSATDCDFRDITLAGAAAGSSPTRAGDCGGNTGITFPVAKTVYWNLAGAQNWSATGWCPSSGGTPDINQFPLAQDTAVFDNTGSVTGTITFDVRWNIGTFNASARTSAMTLSSGAVIYGNWANGTGITLSGFSTLTFSGRGTQTITSNGITFSQNITITTPTGTVQLADALVINSTQNLNINLGTFDAVSYNVTVGLFSSNTGTTTITTKMGSGTWTLSGTGAVWGHSASTNNVLIKGTANIVLSDTSTTARSFAGGSKSYNKLTIGGTTGVSTTTITGDNQFTEIASTKTVAHTIALGSTTQTFGAWTVTGTVGNVAAVTGSGTIIIAGARVSGVDYLALGTTAISTTSPGEFYAGANSTGTGTGVILTTAPSATTRYWRGGTGTWDATTTTNWSTSSGGLGGASVPTSADAVIFDTLSNATAYTVTCTATQLRCAALTMAGPATGNVTFAGTAPLAIHGNVSLAATGITNSYTGAITLTGSATGKTFTTNGITFSSTTEVNGVGSGWTLGSAYTTNTLLTVTNGIFDTGNYSVNTTSFNSDNNNNRTINLGSSTITISSTTPLSFATNTNFTFNAGTSTINCSASTLTFTTVGKTFYNVSFTNTNSGSVSLSGVGTFNNLSFTNNAAAGIKYIFLLANQTINGTLTISAGTDATYRTFVSSDTIGTTRTLTVNSFAATSDIDFGDITIAGTASPISGTRFGDCKGNSGITFASGVNKYWNLAAGGNWNSVGWATSSGGTPAVNNFPLAQDTAIFEATGLNSAATVIINFSYNIGTIDMSARTSNLMTLTNGLANNVYGNWITGAGTTYTGVGTLTFAGRTSQTITSASKTFTQIFVINTPSGSVTLQDSLISSGGLFTVTAGTFNAATYNVNLSSSSGGVLATGAATKTIATGSGVWTIAGSGSAWSVSSVTVTGTSTINLTSASAKTFAGGSISYSGIIINQGGAGTLSFSGNNTFKDITNTYSGIGATTINIGATTQTVTQFTGIGTVSNVLTIQGTSAASPGTLIFSGAGKVTEADYLAITNVRAYSLSNTWYAGANSTNNGSLGWIFSDGAAKIALTGLLALGGLGTTTASQAVSFAVTGVSAAGSLGIVTITQPITSVLATGNVGTITALSSSVVLPVTNVLAIGNAGTITNSQDLARTLTGRVATGNIGTITVNSGYSIDITGAFATGNLGTVTALSSSKVLPVTGVFAIGNLGDASASQDLSRTLTGNLATGNVGTVNYGLSLDLVGRQAAGILGTIDSAQAVVFAIASNFATGSLGTIAASQALSQGLTGNLASGSVGTVAYGLSLDLNNVLANGAVGTVINSQVVTKVLTGVNASGIVGNIVPVSWQLINDAQNANWVLVNNAQTTTWQLINTPT